MPSPVTRTVVVEFGARASRALAQDRSRLLVAKAFGGAVPEIVWLACEPEPFTTITWSETYGVYAGPIPSPEGDPAKATAAVYPAAPGSVYDFLGSLFGTPQRVADLGDGRFSVRNRAPHQLAFGLTQSAFVNGAETNGPVNFAVVPVQQTAEFAASMRIVMWTQPHGASGQLVRRFPAHSTMVELGDGPALRRFRYDPSSARFIGEHSS
jgi:hypothetical protein